MAEETHQERPPHQPPRPAAEQRPPEPTGENLDAAEDEEEHAESQRRSHGSGRRGGRPVKKVYEEWANDPYCE
jgi:hypothetical protein